MIPSTRQVTSRQTQDSADYQLQAACGLVGELAARYRISAFSALQASAQAVLRQEEIAVAVVGRFKAGKSSFLNHFLGYGASSGPLPVGVIPVTASVTEVRSGDRERATVHCLDGSAREIPLPEIGAYISEKQNPGNAKQVARVAVELPQLHRFAGLKFVDTPGLGSALAHNTGTSLGWLPNVGLALVTVSVDPPLSGSDIELLKTLCRYTPKVAILLTKADLLNEAELAEVIEFVRSQAERNLSAAIRIFPYSTRPGFERFRQALESELIGETVAHLAQERRSILSRKVETLLRECAEYLTLSLQSAQRARSEREELKRRVQGAKEELADVKAQIRLVIQSAAAGARPAACRQFEMHQDELERALATAFAGEFPKWTKNLAAMLSWFEDWLAAGLRDHLARLSMEERNAVLAPFERAGRQAVRILQQFRDGLSERALAAFGVPLRTTETEIGVAGPSIPNVRVGRVFDRNWELLSPVLPTWAIVKPVQRHFERIIPYLVYQNLSRLSTQWEESVHAALWALEKEAARRPDELIETVERLLESGEERAPQLRTDLDRVHAARQSLAGK